jgi:hypothetical protein
MGLSSQSVTSETLKRRSKSADYWLRRAHELRRVAALLSPHARSMLLEVAEECERRGESLRAELAEPEED